MAEPIESQTVHRPRPVIAGAEAPPEQGEARAKRNRRPFLVLGALIVLGLLGLAIYSLLTAGRVTTDDAQVEADVVQVAPRVGGTILKVDVVENQKVKKGDPLIELDPADYATKLAQTEADLATAVAQLSAARAQERIVSAGASGGFESAQAAVASSAADVKTAESRVVAAQATVTHRQSDAHVAELDLNRMRQLLADGAVSQKQFDDAQAAYEAAQSAVNEAQAGLAAAEQERTAAESRVAEARGHLQSSAPIEAQNAAAQAQVQLAAARVQSAQAMADRARLDVERTKVLAPEDGTISALSVRRGQVVSENQPLAELVPNSTYIVANFKETQIGKMRPGNVAKIRLDAYRGRSFEGVVQSLSGGTGARFSLIQPDNASGNFVKVVQRIPVRIEWLAPPDVPLRAGLSANVKVDLRKVMAVPPPAANGSAPATSATR